MSRTMAEIQPAPSGCVVWLTGLSGSGKTTLARALRRRLASLGVPAAVVDGDQLRRTLCSDLGFSIADRAENIRRAAEVARILADAEVTAIVALISPLRAARRRARRIVGPRRFFEVYLDPGLAVCERRDVKGLYRKARTGTLRRFTGLSSPYEPPRAPDLRLDTGTLDVEQCLARLIGLLRKRGLLRAARKRC